MPTILASSRNLKLPTLTPNLRAVLQAIEFEIETTRPCTVADKRGLPVQLPTSQPCAD